MATHQFDTEIAKQYGISEAILLNHFYFWLCKNRANEKGFNDGLWWTYNSVKAFSEIFPYMTEYQISRALKSLEDKGLLITGNYNKAKYDRTKWYAMTEKAWQLFNDSISGFQQMETAKTTKPLFENQKPIPDIKPDIKTNNKAFSPSEYVVNTIDDKGYSEALLSFVQHRKEIKSPMTERALKMLISKLETIGKTNTERIQILERSIMNGWKGVFPLNSSTSKASPYEVDYSDIVSEVA